FPPGVLQGDPRYSNRYFNMSSGADVKGPWNEGASTQMGETWQYSEDPLADVEETNALADLEPEGTERTLEGVKQADKTLREIRSKEVKSAMPKGDIQWSLYQNT